MGRIIKNSDVKNRTFKKRILEKNYLKLNTYNSPLSKNCKLPSLISNKKQLSSTESFLEQTYHQNIAENFQNFNLNCNSTKQDFEISIKNSLISWATQNHISHSALNSLLIILRSEAKFTFLPKVSRTLLQTPTNQTVINFTPGKYIHIGVEKCIKHQINKYKLESTSIYIDINIDGLPLSKSSNSQFWPILGQIKNQKTKFPPFVIGIYHGYSKPNSTDFLKPFVNEMSLLSQNGFQLNNRNVVIHIRAVVCDAPAKAFVCATKAHTSLIGCNKCTIEGDFLRNRVCFTSKNFVLKTDEGFRNKIYEDYHKEVTSPFEKLSIGMVTQFPLDYLHLVCLGVMKKLLCIWLNGDLKYRLSKYMKISISNRMLKAEKSQPKEFNRRIRSLQEIGHFKGTEYRTILLYLCPVIFKDILSEEQYLHLLSLHCAIRILADSEKYYILNENALELLQYFVTKFGSLYGKHLISYNVHNLLHLNEDCLKFGSLDNFSAFAFESYMSCIKRFIRKGNNPLQQVANRINEIQFTEKIFGCNVDSKFKLKNPIKHNNECIEKYLCLEMHDFVLDSTMRNKWFMVDNDIIAYEYACYLENKCYVYGGSVKNKTDFYLNPIRSSLLGIYASDSELNIQKFWLVTKITKKIFSINYDNLKIFFPLLH